MSLRILNIKAWDFDLEIWSLNFSKLKIWVYWASRMWNWKLGNENFELKIWILKDTWKLWKRFFFFFWVNWVNLVWLSWLSFDWVLSVWAKILAPHFFVSFFFLFCFIFHQLFLLHWHYSPSHSPWFFFFISPFLLTKSTFLSLLTFPHPSIFL